MRKTLRTVLFSPWPSYIGMTTLVRSNDSNNNEQYRCVCLLVRRGTYGSCRCVCSGVRDAGEDLRVFLLVCGLRRVKDPLYLVEAFSEWHCEEPSVVLVIIGPKMDPIFSVQVEEKLRRAAGVFLAPERSREELHAALQRSFALVNSSISEGMSAAILEVVLLLLSLAFQTLLSAFSLAPPAFTAMRHDSRPGDNLPVWLLSEGAFTTHVIVVLGHTLRPQRPRRLSFVCQSC
ncbi:hypothetical protein Z043_122980 [Scleropages formosus]|uniref:Glycosyl transferase family 1 domain-containing protein n=1 Tax=Scleropages formosus TaxID=113540 RepID=A0A0P7UE56_SCLFO|nr:hypothetical protein Z043_122980 [Scleropages formosus]